ncbi:MAG TPA: hypothetical protein VHO24_05385 [Opitutaceae bacterium]|nr:hypothetical protein [Opitutaceae bacterium]
MSSLLLPADVSLRPNSLALLHEIGVKIFIDAGGNRLEFPPGVAQVVSCVLETEKPFLSDARACVGIDQAIAAISDRIIAPDSDLKPAPEQTT